MDSLTWQQLLGTGLAIFYTCMYAIHLDFTTFITLVFNSMQLDTRQKQKKIPPYVRYENPDWLPTRITRAFSCEWAKGERALTQQQAR